MYLKHRTKGTRGFLGRVRPHRRCPIGNHLSRQVHRARLKDGQEVVIKVIKAQNEKTFRRDVNRMRRWLRVFLIFMPKLRKVGNPVALLNHVADYTTRELDLRNEIKGAEELSRIKEDVSGELPNGFTPIPKIL